MYRVWARDEKILVKHLDLLLKQGQLQLNKNTETCKLAVIMGLAVNCTSSGDFIVASGLCICVPGVLGKEKDTLSRSTNS